MALATTQHAPPAPAAQHKPASPALKMLIGGAVTVFFEGVGGGHFLELLKIQKQTTGLSYGAITKGALRKGPAGLVDGFLPWGLLQCVMKGGVFSLGQAASYKMLHNNTVLSHDNTTVLTGGLGGFIQGVVMSPLLLLKTRVITSPDFRSTPGVMSTAVEAARVGKRVIVSEGAVALMKGSGVFACKRFADWTSRFYFVMLVERALRSHPDEKLTGGRQVFASLAGGTISALLTIPIDVMVATIQDANKAGQRVGVLHTLRARLAENGVRGMVEFSTRGLVARVSHVAMTTLLMKTVTTKVYDALFRPLDE